MRIILFCISLFISSFSLAGTNHANFDPKTLNVNIPVLKTFGLKNELILTDVTLAYDSEKSLWEFTGYRSTNFAGSDSEPNIPTYNAFNGSVTVPKICNLESSYLCYSVIFYKQNIGERMLFSVDGIVDVSDYKSGDWTGNAVDTVCGGVTAGFVMNSSGEGKLTGSAKDQENTTYVINGLLNPAGMDLTAVSSDGGKLSLNCDLNSTATVCSGNWTGSWPGLSCGGTFSLNKK